MDQIGPDPWATFIPILSMSDPNLIHCWQLGAARKGGREGVLIRELKSFPAGTLQAARRQTSSVMVRGGVVGRQLQRGSVGSIGTGHSAVGSAV